MKSPSEISSNHATGRLSPTGRILMLVIGVSLATAIALAFSIRPMVMAEFERIERVQVGTDLERVNGMVAADLRAMQVVAGDWGQWTDTAEFVAGQRDDYVDTNLQPQAIDTIGVDGLVFFDTRRRPVYSVGLDESRTRVVPLSDAVIATLVSHEKLFALPLPKSRGAEMLSGADTAYLAASAPITTSNLAFPASGTLVALRRVDDALLSQIENSTRLRISIDTSGAPQHASTVFRRTGSGEQTPQGYVVVPISDDRLAGIAPMYDDDGRPVFSLAVIEARAMHRAGTRMANIIAGIILLIGVIMGLAGAALIDVIVRRRAGVQLEYLAGHDHLTGLPNRRSFEEAIDRELVRSARSGSRGTVLWLDLDDFKTVNDSLGHHAGDRMLVQVAELLVNSVREGDEVARMGGDEFAVLLPETTIEEAVVLADRIVEGFSAARFDVGGDTVTSSASIGMVEFPTSGDTHGVLLSHADQAMYVVKRRGGHGSIAHDSAAGDGPEPDVASAPAAT